MKRKNYQVSQEFINNGLLVTLNQKDKVYFERIEDFQIFYKNWVENEELTIDECLKQMKGEILNSISLAE